MLKRHMHLVYLATVPAESIGLNDAILSAWHAMESIRSEHELRAKDVQGIGFPYITLLLRALMR